MGVAVGLHWPWREAHAGCVTLPCSVLISPSLCLVSCLQCLFILWLLVKLNSSVHMQVQALQQAVMKIGEHLSGGQGQGEQPQGDTKPEGEGEKKDEQK